MTRVLPVLALSLLLPTAASAQAACTLSPPGGQVVATARSHPEVVVGREGAVLRTSTRGRYEYGMLMGDDTLVDTVYTLRFPISTATVTQALAPAYTLREPVQVMRAGDSAAWAWCDFAANLGHRGCIARTMAGAEARLEHSVTAMGEPLPMAWAVVGTRFFAATLDDQQRLVAMSALPGQAGTSAVLARSVSTAVESPITLWPQPDGTVIARVDLGRGRATEATIGAGGERLGDPRRIITPAAMSPGIRVEVERASRRATPHVRIASGEGALQPVGGLEEAAATFGPDLAGSVLVWSEGLRDATHIRAARIDPQSLAVVGAIAEISTTGREAGFATIDSFGGHTVVAWDEKNGAVWEIHAAELVCP
jgi:hypothetical protein